MDIVAFLEPFLILFSLVGLGALVAHLHIMGQKGVEQTSSLVLNVTLPAVIFVTVAVEMSPQMLTSVPLVVGLGVGLGVVNYTLGLLASRVLRMGARRRGVFAFAASCTNTGFLGIPLVGAVFGPVAAVTAFLFDFATTINVFTFGVAGLESSFTDRPEKLRSGAKPKTGFRFQR